MFRFFAIAFVDQFASALLREVSPQLSPANPAERKAKKAGKQGQKREIALAMLHRKAVDFGRREKLNFFQKARLSKQLQDGLIRCGQSAEFAKDFAVKVIADLR